MWSLTNEQFEIKRIDDKTSKNRELSLQHQATNKVVARFLCI
jgi:hypothetical protein